MSIPAVADREATHEYHEYHGVYDHYVGDPCYVIPDDRWSEFCDKLFALETYRKYGGGIIRWEVDGETYLIDVHNSPFGDGTWSFDMQDDEGNDIVLGVDAGLLAIVPMECVCPKADFYLGAVFHGEPTLETLEQDGGIVELNGQRNKGYYESLCEQCGDYDSNLEYCEATGSDVCWMCWEEPEEEE